MMGSMLHSETLLNMSPLLASLMVFQQCELYVKHVYCHHFPAANVKSREVALQMKLMAAGIVVARAGKVVG